jgi:hypothetical protein
VVRPIEFQTRQRGQAIIASLLTGIVLLLNAMAASPALHELFHSDANSGQHHCAVTLFAHGQVDSAPVDVAPDAVFTPFQAVFQIEFSVFRPVIENLPSGRAPPVASFHS